MLAVGGDFELAQQGRGKVFQRFQRRLLLGKFFDLVLRLLQEIRLVADSWSTE